jgi:hypothetical protein
MNWQAHEFSGSHGPENDHDECWLIKREELVVEVDLGTDPDHA